MYKSEGACTVLPTRLTHVGFALRDLYLMMFSEIRLLTDSQNMYDVHMSGLCVSISYLHRSVHSFILYLHSILSCSKSRKDDFYTVERCFGLYLALHFL